MQVTAPPHEIRADAVPAAGDARDILRLATEWLPIGVLVVDAEGMLVVVNREIERLFGYPDGELLGQTVDVLVPESARGHHAAFRHEFTAQPRARAMGASSQVFGRRKDGSEVPIEVRLTPVCADDSMFVLASVIDVAERDRARLPLDEQLAFDRFVGELAAGFVNIRADEVDCAVQDALDRVVRTLGLDYGALFQVEESGDFVHTHQSIRAGCAPPLPRISARLDFPWHLSRIRAGELVSFAAVDQVPDAVDRESLRRIGTMSAVTIPLTVERDTWGALSFCTMREPRTWAAEMIDRLRVVGVIFTNALARRLADERLRRRIDVMIHARERLRDENRYLRDELQRLSGAHAIVGHSPAIRRTLDQVREAAATDFPVLLIGETGTGKTLLATRIHDLSARRERAMVRVNCADTTALIDGRVFGNEANPLTSEEPAQVGRLELASGSTVFFDEIADLSLGAQASLLRVLHDGQIQPPGHGTPVRVDLRIIAASRRDLKRCIAAGTFREDLYHRLAVFPIHVPPLRERREDIPVLVWRFVDEFSVAYRRPIDVIDEASMNALQAYTWPGNARELRHVVEHALIGATTRRLHILPPSEPWIPQVGQMLTAVETNQPT